MNVMRDLRDPDTGCPWDLEQDFSSIAPHTIEEAYEVADAIDRGDMHDLCEELGDLLFQSVYHAQLASEVGAFDLYDVVEGVTKKMIERHPHVFDDAQASDSSDVNEIWDQEKDKEKQARLDVKAQSGSVLDDVPRNLPALMRAQKMTKRAARKGFEWKDSLSALDKVEEELKELRAAIVAGDVRNEEEELGDVLFSLASYARMRRIDSEESLRKACGKFYKRFSSMESTLDKLDEDSFSELPVDQVIALWNEQKGK